jgi:hypothetical protein
MEEQAPKALLVARAVSEQAATRPTYNPAEPEAASLRIAGSMVPLLSKSKSRSSAWSSCEQ